MSYLDIKNPILYGKCSDPLATVVNYIVTPYRVLRT
jgi:hypothetical protein